MLRAQPQRHRGTETAQSQPPGVCPQITQMTQIHRTGQTTEAQRRHRANRPRHNHEDTKTRRNHKATRSSGEVPAAGRPGTAGSGCSLGRKRPDQHPLPAACALGERRPRLSNFFWLGWVSNAGARAGTTTAGPTRPARRPGRRSSGTNACVRSRRASSREAAITIAGVAAAPLRATSSPQAPLLCAFASLRLCVFFSVSPSVSSVPLWFARCDGSVSLCLCGFSENTGQHSEFRIPNSEFS